ncbi:MFS transporter [Rhodobacteraceae bacterium RKSG542]|uniref:MFS transporter n=1 Tax=Pseudovibrio flavus TaxID=2529854 RepID=UPI0012BBE839|nr:MFS transporter [Pseudovibrio flavus]MTI16734.1 MFS transporter [Pseudovibrio flavus]
MSFTTFIKDNARWLAGGFILVLCAGYGQVYVIGQFSPFIRELYDLSHGEFGSLFMMITLSAGGCLMFASRYIDRLPAAKMSCICLAMLAGAAMLMACQTSIYVLAFALLVLRLFGQGMLPLLSQTAMARWYNASRGKALSVSSTGHMCGEAVLPLVILSVILTFGWRWFWAGSALVLALAVLPACYFLLKKERVPEGADPKRAASLVQIDWQKNQVIRDWRFWVVVTARNLYPFFITSLMFHQAYLMELKGWQPEIFAGFLPLYAGISACSAFGVGFLVDRYRGVSLLPYMTLPLVAAILLFGAGTTTASYIAAFVCLAVSFGSWNASTAAILSEMYGTKHIGEIRSVLAVTMVAASAVSPGITGNLIDNGITLDIQFIWLSGFVFLFVALLFFIQSKVRAPRPPASFKPL